MKGPVFTLPNILSLSRIPLGLAASFFLWRREIVPTAITVFLAISTDFLDGFIARRTGTASEWGRIFDPMADKLAMGVFLVTLVAVGAVPPWFAAVFVGKDVLIAAGGLYMTAKTGSPPSSDMWGKTASFAVSFYMTVQAVSHILGREISAVFLGLSPLGVLALIFVLVSFYSYCSTFAGEIFHSTPPGGDS